MEANGMFSIARDLNIYVDSYARAQAKCLDRLIARGKVVTRKVRVDATGAVARRPRAGIPQTREFLKLSTRLKLLAGENRHFHSHSRGGGFAYGLTEYGGDFWIDSGLAFLLRTLNLSVSEFNGGLRVRVGNLWLQESGMPDRLTDAHPLVEAYRKEARSRGETVSLESMILDGLPTKIYIPMKVIEKLRQDIGASPLTSVENALLKPGSWLECYINGAQNRHMRLFLTWAVFGRAIPKATPVSKLEEILSTIPKHDFGLRDVELVRGLVRIVEQLTGGLAGASEAQHLEAVAGLDGFLAACGGTPVKREGKMPLIPAVG